MTYDTSLYIFRRDLRIIDNTALNAALMQSKKVIPCFIFDEHQILRHEYFSENAFLFMVQSLQDLQDHLEKNNGKLFVFKGVPHEIIKQLHDDHNINAVFFNKDYTPFSQKRDASIKQQCDALNIDFISMHDYLLSEPENVLTQTGNPYKVFTPFWRNAYAKGVREPQGLHGTHFFSEDINHSISLDAINVIQNPNLYVKGGRTHALHILKHIDTFKHYKEQRNFPALDSTTGLSAHHKFGTVSIREVYYRFKTVYEEHDVLRELYWRDFFTHLVFHFPELLHTELQTKVRNIRWENNDQYFELWTQGKTGFPIIDAGMRELNQTGYIHNRVRMIVASFLTKDLHIDWRWGEKYFAQKLVDYDPAVNNGNWQWAASVGADTKMRIFNPWLQQEKYDANCEYIKKWVPELQQYNPDEIHRHVTEHLEGYEKPIIDHNVERKKAWTYYRP